MMATITMEKQPRRETSGCCVSAAYQSYIKRSQIETPCDLENHDAGLLGKITLKADRVRHASPWFEAITRDVVMIDTEGFVAGQVNGLSVLSLGQASFGRPTRITARARMGKGNVVD